MAPPLNVEVKSFVKLEKACRKADKKGELGQPEHCGEKRVWKSQRVKGVGFQRSVAESGGRSGIKGVW
jgi:hypothetical protein